MPPKMSERVDALEERISALEGSVQNMFDEFRQTILAEFAKLMNRPTPETPEASSVKDSADEFKMAVKKVELPAFNGDDPVGWITRAETYFEVQGTTEEVKVRLAKLSMEGTTIHWFNLLRETEDNLTWLKLKQALIDRYGGRSSDNLFEELKDLKQTGDVEDYISEFEYVSSQVNRLPEEQYLGYFLGGLKPEIRLKVRTFNPMTRLQAMRVARDIETELRGSLIPRSGGRNWVRDGKGNGSTDFGSGSNKKGGNGSNFDPGPNRNGLTIRSTESSQNKGNQPDSNSNQTVTPNANLSRHTGDDGRRGNGDRNRGIKHLPYSELMDRKARGLCFRCGERYNPLHQCAEKQFRLVILSDDETVNDAGEVIAIELQEGDEVPALEYNSMALCGLKDRSRIQSSFSKLLYLEGTVKGKSVTVLIDTGASHNLISLQMVSNLQIPIDTSKAASVKFGNGGRVAVVGKGEGLQI
jgi:hypothetical protein